MKDKDQIAEEIRRLEAENEALKALNESTRNQIDLFEKMARKVISGQEMSESDHQRVDESTPKTSFYYKWLQSPISSSSEKIFPQRSYGYACGILSHLPRS